MRIFVTGATGWVGAAVVRELAQAGHEVLGLARSEAGAASLQQAGVQVQRGTLEDVDGLRRGARACDAVIHTAFNHDFSRFAENSELDRRAIEAMGEELAGSDRRLIVTSGVAHLAQGRPATEDDRPAAATAQYPRVSEATAQQMADRGVRAAIVRLAPTVHGAGDHGFVPHLIALARQKGVSAYVGAGDTRWSAVHRFDAAHLYRLAVEAAEPAARYHAIAEEGIPFREIAQRIGEGLGVEVVSLAPEEAEAHFGWFIRFAAGDMQAVSERTRAALGWQPRQPGLLDDLQHSYALQG